MAAHEWSGSSVLTQYCSLTRMIRTTAQRSCANRFIVFESAKLLEAASDAAAKGFRRWGLVDGCREQQIAELVSLGRETVQEGYSRIGTYMISDVDRHDLYPPPSQPMNRFSGRSRIYFIKPNVFFQQLPMIINTIQASHKATFHYTSLRAFPSLLRSLQAGLHELRRVLREWSLRMTSFSPFFSTTP